jgi:hypothetical protein
MYRRNDRYVYFESNETRFFFSEGMTKWVHIKKAMHTFVIMKVKYDPPSFCN